MNINNLIQHSLKLGGTKYHLKWVKVSHLYTYIPKSTQKFKQ
jgi:hypothetical protein